MAITDGSTIEIALQMVHLGQEMINAYQYDVAVNGSVVGAADVAAAWWNVVKTAYRALSVTTDGEVFRTVRIADLSNPLGDFAQWDIPAAEQTGTRAAPSQSERLPPYVAVGVRLTVGSRITRPGQKRIPFLTESDNVGGILQAPFRSLVGALFNILDGEIALAAPATDYALSPVVVRKIRGGGIAASQPVIGHLINTNLTTQNSRKYGRGS